MKILILRFSSIGDIVLTTPVLRCLAQQIENVEIHYCTKQKYYSLLKSNPYVEKFHLYEKNLGKLLKNLKNEKFDFVIDLHHNLRTLLIKKYLNIPDYSFDKLNWQKWLLVNFKINKLPTVHIVDRYLETLKSLNVHNDQMGLDFFLEKEDIVNVSEMFTSRYVAFAIGAQHFTKRLPKEKVVEFCININKPIVLLGGPEDYERGEQIKNDLIELGHVVFNACGKYSINQSAFIIQQSEYVVSNDTGLMHIAAAFKKKIYVTWGNTIPAFGMYPYKTEFINIENNNLNCRPCSKIGFSKCPKGHFKCMKDLVWKG